MIEPKKESPIYKEVSHLKAEVKSLKRRLDLMQEALNQAKVIQEERQKYYRHRKRY